MELQVGAMMFFITSGGQALYGQGKLPTCWQVGDAAQGGRLSNSGVDIRWGEVRRQFILVYSRGETVCPT